MSKRPLATAAEGLPSPTIINPSVNPAALSGLSIEELCSLSEGVRILSEVATGLLCQPRFESALRGIYNAAGDQLEVFSTALSDCLNAVRKETELRTAADWQEARKRAFFLVSDEANYCDEFEELCELVTALRKSIAVASFRGEA